MLRQSLRLFTRARTSVQLSLPRHQAGTLLAALKPLDEAGLNIDHLQSRVSPYESPSPYTSLFFDLSVHESDPLFQRVLDQWKKTLLHVRVLGSWQIPPFPSSLNEALDDLGSRVLGAGAELQDDPSAPHPGFHDEEYRARRREICALSEHFTNVSSLPHVEYTLKENQTWEKVWDTLTALYPTHACREYNAIFPLLVEGGVFSRSKIPQLASVNAFLQDATGFRIRPVSGLLSSRDFLAALAFRVFCSTQYIRHSSQPLYTPEPDVIHELMGHVPLFCDPVFADFSQQFGLLSLGASDDIIEKLARCYWFSVEFGLIRDQASGNFRAYGAGLLSSFGELQYAVQSDGAAGKDPPQIRSWNPAEAAAQEFPITSYQPVFFAAESFKDAQRKLLAWGQSLQAPFHVEYNAVTGKIKTFSQAPKLATHNRLI